MKPHRKAFQAHNIRHGHFPIQLRVIFHKGQMVTNYDFMRVKGYLDANV